MSQWYDPLFDNWYEFMLDKLKDKVDMTIIKQNGSLPSHYMNYLYILHYNNNKEIKTDHIVSQIITDMNLEEKK